MFRKIKSVALLGAALALFMPEGAKGEDLTLKLSALAGATYDTNVLLLPEKEKKACNFRLNVSTCGGDYVLTFSPELDLVNENKRLSFNFQYKPVLNYYLGHPALNNISQFASLAAKGELSERSRIYMNDGYAYTVESLQATTTGIQTRRGVVWSNAAALGGDYDLTPRSNLGVSLADDIVWFKAPSTVKSRTDSAALTETFKATENTSVRGSYTFTNIFFASAFNSNIVSHSLMAGLNYRATPTLTLDASAGAYYTPEIRQLGWLGTASVTKKFERSTLTAGYARALVPTGLAAEEALNETASLAWNFSLTDRLDMGVAGNYARNKTVPQTTVDVSSYTTALNGSWHPSSWAAVSAGLTHFHQWAKGGIAEAFNRNTAFVNLTVFPFERRF